LKLCIEEGKADRISRIRPYTRRDRQAFRSGSEPRAQVRNGRRRLTRKNLNDQVPLIGFAGSPWTLATYMVEGKGSKNFRAIKELIYSKPKDAHVLLDKLARTVAAYLSAKIEAGAQAVQIFDTWGGILPPDEFENSPSVYRAGTPSAQTSWRTDTHIL